MSDKRYHAAFDPRRRKMLLFRVRLASAMLAACLGASAQSLDPQAPTPLATGENRGTLDSMVGPQYWSFKYKKGSGNIAVRFASMGLFGNPMVATIQVVLHAPNGQVIQSRSLTSRGPVVELNMPGTFAGPGTATVELRPEGSNLVRSGGDYSIVVSGAGIDVSGPAASGKERIVGTYAVMVCPPDFDCQGSLAIHFSADGTVQTTDGHSGTWKVFDPEALVYTVVIGSDRWTLKLVPGRGLFNTNDLSVVVFQAVRPK